MKANASANANAIECGRRLIMNERYSVVQANGPSTTCEETDRRAIQATLAPATLAPAMVTTTTAAVRNDPQSRIASGSEQLAAESVAFLAIVRIGSAPVAL